MDSLRQNYQTIAAAALLVGAVLITIAEMPSMHWTRAFGAAGISLGAVGLGIYLGLRQPGVYRSTRERLAQLKAPIGLITIVLVFLPALLGLGAGLVGLFSSPNGAGWVIAVGALVLALMLAATLAGLLVGVQAVLAAGSPAHAPEGDAE